MIVQFPESVMVAGRASRLEQPPADLRDVSILLTKASKIGFAAKQIQSTNGN